ncbi:trans-aconitate 2-methyltransferase [Pyricularia oryzae 70-15]|uniref:Trans-aconitate 2-methyltransferase n=2 Tax=Pyricularia oryzae TaxID=318829 RepID=G4NG78_PYRO7|nr:trans-aconitate 2-methyltransferase [Pyricularia oryzae 70-15]EHA47035.1 trans-aconitate 2-methyltransferase [Pyricularia oryzae 70-15]ELQ32921.1 trans-aconitate 2-methyltransferase [Pyricularia oryzae Y34]KAI7909657.1 trans-aconitate 2-methyltransferase [Pyricularia oryzae]
MTADTKELAKGYTVNNATQHNAGLFLLDRLAVKPGMHVLDVGCGPGNLTAHIAEVVGPTGKVVGMDPSKERIALAEELAPTKSNLSFVVGQAEDLSRFADGSFDIIYVNSTFHWIGDQARALREFHRVLKPGGGRVGISGGSGDFVAWHQTVKAAVMAQEPFCQYPDTEGTGPKFLKREEMERLLGLAGFADYSMVINVITKEVKDGYAMIEWLDTSSSGKTYGGVPLELQPQAREAMKREWDKYMTENGIKMDMELLVTVATKS